MIAHFKSLLNHSSSFNEHPVPDPTANDKRHIYSLPVCCRQRRLKIGRIKISTTFPRTFICCTFSRYSQTVVDVSKIYFYFFFWRRIKAAPDIQFCFCSSNKSCAWAVVAMVEPGTNVEKCYLSRRWTWHQAPRIRRHNTQDGLSSAGSFVMIVVRPPLSSGLKLR